MLKFVSVVLFLLHSVEIDICGVIFALQCWTLYVWCYFCFTVLNLLRVVLFLLHSVEIDICGVIFASQCWNWYLWCYFCFTPPPPPLTPTPTHTHTSSSSHFPSSSNPLTNTHTSRIFSATPPIPCLAQETVSTQQQSRLNISHPVLIHHNMDIPFSFCIPPIRERLCRPRTSYPVLIHHNNL